METTWRVISGEGKGENGEKVQGIRSINGRYKIDRERLRIVREMEKPKKLYMTHGHELRWRNANGRGMQGGGE